MKKLEDRKEEFIDYVLENYGHLYSPQLLEDFLGYWTEHGIKDKKMRHEKQKSFGVGRRLATWKRNSKKFGNDYEENERNNKESIARFFEGRM